MNDINRVNAYGQVPPVGRPPNSGPGKSQPETSGSPKDDQVQISQNAIYLSKIAALPEIRAEKVENVKQAFNEGTYDINGKLSLALDRFMDEYGL